MKKQPIDWRVLSTAIIAIAGLTGFALWLGYNGILLTTAIAIVAGIAGWTLPQAKIK